MIVRLETIALALVALAWLFRGAYMLSLWDVIGALLGLVVAWAWERCNAPKANSKEA